MIDTALRVSPFRGPRSFQTGDTLYGRDREARALLATLIAERIVLLHSPSGAGKTSLVQAALVPALAEREFLVLPVVRVGAAPEQSGANRYLRSALIALEEGLPAAERLPADELDALTLGGYLARRVPEDADPVLIFDQFEEVLTRDPTDTAAKHAFFAELGAALRERRYRALFSMREDYVAALEPFLRHLPTRLGVHFRLDLLGVEGGRQALAEPVRQAGVAFPDALVEALIDDLRVVNVQQADGRIAQQPGPSVEPVQLQILGLRLWGRLAPDAEVIGAADVAALGDVGSALGDYYAEQVAAAAATAGVQERAARAWFDRELITPQGVRGQVLQGHERSAGLENRAIRALIDAYVVRAEPRRGATWFELAHDRLIAPVRASNAAWEEANLSALQRQADLWERQGRPAGMVLRGETLREAETWAATNPEALTASDIAFLQLSREARRQAQRVRSLAIGASLLAVAATLAFVTALWFFNRAEQQRRLAVARELAAAALGAVPVDPEQAVLLGLQAVEGTRDAGEPAAPEALEALQLANAASRLERRLAGPEGALMGVAFSPDGATLAGSSKDGTIWLWPVDGGEPRSLTGHTGEINRVAFSPDGATLASAGDDGTLRLWEVASGAERLRIDGAPESVIFDVAFSPDGALVAAAAYDGVATLYDAASGAPALAIDGHEGYALNAVAFSPDGARLATAADDNSARVWDLAEALATGAPPVEPLLTLAGHTDYVMDVAFSPDGATILTAGLDRQAIIWDAESGAPLRTLAGHSLSLYGAAFSPDGALVATGSSDGTARVWSASSGASLLALAGHGDWVRDVAFGPGGQQLATAGYDGTARLWSLALLPPDDPYALAFSPDGAQLASAGADGVTLWETTSGGPRARLSSEAGANTVAYSPDGARLAAADEHGMVLVWGLAAPAEPPLALAGHSQGVSKVAFSPDGAWLASASDDSTVRLWDATAGDELQTLAGHSNLVFDVAFSPDGRLLASGDTDGTIIIWEPATGAELRRLQAADSVYGLAFSPDGALLAAASADGAVVVWSTGDWSERYGVAHSGVTSIAFSPDGRQLASVGSDKALRLWEASTGAPLWKVPHGAGVRNLTFAPDGASVATVADGGATGVYPLALEALLADARARLTRGLSADECQSYHIDPCPARP